MGRYPAEALDLKFEWMRAKQRKKAEREARRAERETVVERRIEPGYSVLLPSRPSPKMMLRVRQVAEILGVSRRTVVRWFGGRAVVAPGPSKSRSVMLISQRDLDDWMREHKSR